MPAKTRDRLTTQLFRAVLSLKDEQQCSDFFEDICTITELKAMAQRLEVARLLDEGEIYEEIVEKTGAKNRRQHGDDIARKALPCLRCRRLQLRNARFKRRQQRQISAFVLVSSF